MRPAPRHHSRSQAKLLLLFATPTPAALSSTAAATTATTILPRPPRTRGTLFWGGLFALAYRTVLDRLHAAFPDLHVFCFWDNTPLVGPTDADRVARAISWLNRKEGAIRVNLTFNDDKLQAWSPRAPSAAGLAHLASAGVGHD